MASKKTKFTVGLFVAVGIGIILLITIWLGVTRYFEKGNYYVTYFNESIQGLDRDSPVKYRGVTIGRAAKIGVAPDSELIEVALKIETVLQMGDKVAQLKPVGITGSMFIELDQQKKDEPDRSPYLSFPTTYPVVASKPSDISELIQGIDSLLDQLNALDLEGISDKLKVSLENLSQAIVDANVKAISENLNQAITDANVKTISGNINESLETFEKKVLARAESTTARFERHLVITGQNLEKATENLNRLLEILSNQPSQLLFGEPPPPRKLEPES